MTRSISPLARCSALVLALLGGLVERSPLAHAQVARLTLDLQGAPVQDKKKVPARLREYQARRGHVQLDAPVAIEIRGGSSDRKFAKKSYSLEFRDEHGKPRPRPLLGMPAGKDWVLHACFTDKTCLRNALVYSIGRQLGRYSPRTRFAELTIDGEYKGLYLVVERIAVGRQRVDLRMGPGPSTGEGDPEGGYIIRREGRGRGEGKGWLSHAGVFWNYHYPKAEKITPAHRLYLFDKVKAFERAMKKDWAADPTRGYPALIDLDSWVDYALVQELTNNVDAYWRSMYLYLPARRAGARLHLGPLWDFDIALGNANFREGWRTDVWAHQANRFASDQTFVPPFVERLWSEPGFSAALRTRWTKLRRGPLAERVLMRTLDRWSRQIAPALARDHRLWRVIGNPIWPNWYVGSTSAEELAWLKGWLHSRLLWLDEQLKPAPSLARTAVH